MKYYKIRKTPKQLLSLTGFSLLEFEAFLPTFKYHWDEYHSHFTLKGKPRIRISYGRKSSQLPCILLDGTERPIERPKDSDRQKSCNSGKKNS